MRLVSSSWSAATILIALASPTTFAQGPRPGGPEGRGGPPGGMAVIAALDADGDGELSAGEIDNAAKALRALDKNKDGKLTRDELLPASREGGPGGPDSGELV